MSMQRLHIVVPYRDRASHLDAFVPHVRAYFARDKLDLMKEGETVFRFDAGKVRPIEAVPKTAGPR